MILTNLDLKSENVVLNFIRSLNIKRGEKLKLRHGMRLSDGKQERLITFKILVSITLNL